MIRYDPARDVTPAFLTTVAHWIANIGEVLVVLRYLCGAGSIDFVLCHSVAEFESVVDLVPAGTDIEVFREPQLALRGLVTAEFIRQALEYLPEGAEYLALRLVSGAALQFPSEHCDGNLPEDLVDYLTRFIGTEFAVGLCPEYCVDDHESFISASKGGLDGPR